MWDLERRPGNEYIARFEEDFPFTCLVLCGEPTQKPIKLAAFDAAPNPRLHIWELKQM